MANRFDYVAYDAESTKKQADIKAAFQAVEQIIDESLTEGRAKSLVMTHLEIAYMWTGKAVRDEQLGRGSQTADVPARTNE